MRNSPSSLNSLSAFCERKTTIYVNWRSGKIVIKAKNLLLHSADGSETVLPLAGIRRLVLIGKTRINSQIIYELMRKAIPVDYLDVFGHPLGQIIHFEAAFKFRIKYQAEFAATAQAFELAKSLLLAKVDNCHEILRRRTYIGKEWKKNRENLANAANPEQLRGCEGICAREYFAHWQGILHNFAWQGRHARPAPDPVNMLLSLGYSLLYNRLASALNNVGLDPRLGFFHESRGLHSALASDLMEALRALVDACVLTMLRKEEVAPDDFRIRAGNCVCAKKDILVKILASFENMFESLHTFYIAPEKVIHRTLNDLLDDMAESYAIYLQEGYACLIPRLAQCTNI